MTAATVADVVGRAAAAFAPSGPRRFGAEVEWLIFDHDDPTCAVSADRVAAIAAGPLPAGGATTIEPGGQLELVTEPLPGPGRLVAAIEADAAALAARFAAERLALVSLGLDPVRPPRRSLARPRYEAMEAYFAARSPTGLRMMNLTASLQINVDLGPDPASTWRTLHAVGPVLAAAFANSPTTDGASWDPVSHRQRIWAATDPARTKPVGDDPSNWADYVLDAPVMLRHGHRRIEPQLGELTMREWLSGTAPPTVAEVDLHLTTLFPPLRPRGYLELRMLDALPVTGRTAAIATVAAIVTDDDVGAAAREACGSVTDPWTRATEAGLDDSALAEAAAALLELAAVAIAPSAPDLAEACRSWRDRRVLAPRLPTDVAELLTRSAEHSSLPPGR